MQPRSQHPRPIYVTWEYIEGNRLRVAREPWVLTAEGCPNCRRQGSVYRPDRTHAPLDQHRMCAQCLHVWEYNREPAPATGIRVQMVRQLALARGLA